VIFDESGDLKNLEMKDDDDLIELFKAQNIEANRPEAEGNLKSNGSDPSLAEKMKKDDQPTMGPGLSHDASQEETCPLENDDSEDEKEQTVQPQPLASKLGWKHISSHPLENLMSPLNSGMQTKSKTRNLVAFSTFISTIEPKNVKEALKDAGWFNSMQDKLHQFERSSVWYLVPRPADRTIVRTR